MEGKRIVTNGFQHFCGVRPGAVIKVFATLHGRSDMRKMQADSFAGLVRMADKLSPNQ